jgi:hypothetical protein
MTKKKSQPNPETEDTGEVPTHWEDCAPPTPAPAKKPKDGK